MDKEKLLGGVQMKQWELEYYITPSEYVSFDKRQKQIRNLDLTGWKEIHLGHSHKSFPKHNSTYFVEDVEFISRLLWNLKSDDEKIMVCVCESWRNSIFRERVMLELTDIEEELPECFGGRGAFIFQSQDKIQKYVYINPGETLQCYFKEEFLNEIIKVVEKIATQTKYELYELGE